MASEKANIAHLLRRTTFGPHPGQVEALAGDGYDAAVDRILSLGSTEGGLYAAEDVVTEVPKAVRDDNEELTLWWIEQMSRPEAGLHEKLTWFWHGHFTSSLEKAGPGAMAAQHELIRRHAQGNFREMARAIVVDGAMLMYLDGDGSNGADPNENLARELMELFTVGRGHYTQADVRAAAQALSGWWVEYETGETEWDRERAYLGVVDFLGQKGRFRPPDVVDILCDHPACAPFVAAKLHHYLAGTWPTAERTDELAEVFADYEIQPLVENIVTHPTFVESRLARPRYSIEWFTAARAVLGLPPYELWTLETLGQMPFQPPNVSGWPATDRWLSPSMTLTRGNLLLDAVEDLDPDTYAFSDDDPVPDALERASLYEVSDETRAALDDAYWAPFDGPDTHRLMLLIALNAPEFSLA